MSKSNRFICEIDGDCYELTIPTIEIWQDMHMHLGIDAVKQFLETSVCALYQLEEEPDGAVCGESFVWSTAQIAEEAGSPTKLSDFILWRELYQLNEKDSRWEIEGNENDQIPIYPMLIPLDKKMRRMTKQFKTDNPNGIIVTGGSFHCNKKCTNVSFTMRKDGVSYQINENSVERNTLTDIDPETNWSLGDTNPGDTLEWLVWDGCLIAKNAVFAVKAKNLPEVFSYVVI